MTNEGFREIYKGNVFKLKVVGLNNALRRLKLLRDKGIVLKPILDNTLEAFKRNMRAGFQAHFTPDNIPMRWKKLSKKYAKYKFRKTGIRIANLVWSGRLRTAVNGGTGWYQEITNNKAEFGIRGIPYASVHQYGYKNIPARRYFLAKGNKLPDAVINYMIGQIEQLFLESK